MRTKQRKTKADYRAEIDAAPQPARSFIESEIDSFLAQGPAGVRAQQRVAINAAAKYMDRLADEWKRETPYLTALQQDNHPKAHASARYARRWRPRFLAAYSVSDCFSVAARYARIDRRIAYVHRQNDKEFAAQCEEAHQQAVDLLEVRGRQLALEGNLEPVYYMGVIVDYVRKFDSKLLIEMLRAKRPSTFKTPGTNVNIGTRGDVFVLTEEQRLELQRLNRERILSEPLPESASGCKMQPLNANDLQRIEGDTLALPVGAERDAR